MNVTPLILVVDDDLLLQRATVRLLNQAGYRTCQASDGLTGLQMVREHKPDLTLLDVQLPDISGIHVCHRIKADPAQSSSFVVLVSGTRTDPQSQVDGLDEGADGYIVRPVTNAELLARVRGILRIKQAEDRLRENELKYRLLFENMAEGFSLHEIITDANDQVIDFRFLEANHAYEQHTGLNPQAIIGKTMREIMSQADLRQIENYGKVAITGEPFAVEYFSPAFGRHLRVRAFCPQRGRFATIFEDITESKRAEETLRASENRLQSLFETMAEGVVLINPEGQIIHANLAAVGILGLSRSEIQSRHYTVSAWAIVRPDGTVMPPEEMAGSRAMTERRPVKNQVLGVTQPNGLVRWISVSATPLINKADGFEGVVCTFADITERKQAEDALRQAKASLETTNRELRRALDREQQLARTDPLTGVGNRLRFFELAEQAFQVAVRYQQDCSIIMLDVDHFKNINDTFGHVAGDHALRLIACAVQDQLRASDVLARYGGEEFVTLLPATSATQAATLAERIRKCVAALVVATDTGDARMTVSIGVASVMPTDASLDCVIQRADQALYRAKETGRNRVS